MRSAAPILLALLLAAGLSSFAFSARGSSPENVSIPILVYHRFGPTVADSMTVSLATFESQLRYISEHRYHVVPLKDALDYLSGKAVTLPTNPVVVTDDDGHLSVYTYMAPLIRRLQAPVTLFIYPSAISNAPYAMTWEQLTELKNSGLFTIQSHGYWHPNFKIEQRRLTASDYDRLVDTQMTKSKGVLQKRLAIDVNLLAWPFGIYDEELIQHAHSAGYVAAFTIERRNASRQDDLMALPRYLITDADRGNRFGSLLEGKAAEPRPRR